MVYMRSPLENETDASAPACEVSFSSVPRQEDLSSLTITIQVANTDFGGSDEYIKAVIVSGQTIVMGNDDASFMVNNGADNKCDEMTQIMVNQPAPIGVVNNDNEVGMCSMWYTNVGLLESGASVRILPHADHWIIS